jgi:tripeptidyl-peptidase-1
MLNDARISSGKTPLGFLNPFLYSSGYTALNDITMGNNPGCGTEGFNVCHIHVPFRRVIDADACGQATIGWDPGESINRLSNFGLVLTVPAVTGFGSPNFEKLKAMVLSMP